MRGPRRTGALAGCCLAGPEDVVGEVREWRRRLGGTLFGMWPGAASALTSLRHRLPLMPAYRRPVVPDPPQTPMLHPLLCTTPDAFTATARRLAADEGLGTSGGSGPPSPR